MAYNDWKNGLAGVAGLLLGLAVIGGLLFTDGRVLTDVAKLIVIGFAGAVIIATVWLIGWFLISFVRHRDWRRDPCSPREEVRH